MPPRIPPYFEAMLGAWRAGHVGRDVHYGWWPAPPPEGPLDFAAAQARLTALALDLAGAAPGETVLDVGCGFGGTLAALGARHAGLHLLGLNVDPRQLAVCASLPPGAGNRLSLLAADAVALPLRPASLDLVLCLEAAFHFPSRAAFLREAARVLKPGGRLLLGDILLTPGQAPWPDATMAEALARDYGPWPEPWLAEPALLARPGLQLEARQDVTQGTLPSYRVVAPFDEAGSATPSAGGVLRWLHGHGRLRYLLLRFRRDPT